MASLNKVMLIGNVGRDAELAYLANATAKATFSLAVNRSHRNPAGEWETETEWFNVVAWRELAERCTAFVTKGKQIYVEGRFQTRSWETDGQKHYRTEVIAEKVIGLGAKDEGGKPASGWENAATDIDDLPFS